MFGGFSLLEGVFNTLMLNELWCYNFAENKWKYLQTTGEIPKGVLWNSTILYGNYIVVFGGTGYYPYFYGPSLLKKY